MIVIHTEHSSAHSWHAQTQVSMFAIPMHASAQARHSDRQSVQASIHSFSIESFIVVLLTAMDASSSFRRSDEVQN